MKRRLSIVRVMPFFAPASRYGGCVSQADATSRELARRGHGVRVITTDLGVDARVPRDAWTARDGFEVFYASTRSWHGVPPYPAAAPREVFASAIAAADVVCCNVGLTLANHTARRVATRAGVPYVYNAEGALCPHRLGIKATRKRVFLALFERRILRDAAALQAVCEKERDDLVRQGADRHKVHVIPNGVAPAPVLRAREAVRAAWGVPPDADVVLFAGRLHAIKGLDLLVDAFARAATHPVLVVAGPDDGEESALRARVERHGLADRVHFVGAIAPGDLGSVLAAADVFALTSRTEGLPNAALEAAAAGLPLLVTDRCNLPEVRRYDAGFVVEPEVDAIAAALDDLVSRVAHRRERAENAKRMVEQVFALGPIVDRLEGLYRSLVA